MRKIILTISLLALLTASVELLAQYSFFYGKNKIQKESYDWHYVETPHLRVHYYTDRKDLLDKIARAAEAGYEHISNYLNIKVDKKIPLIFYNTHMEFLLTNIAGYVPSGAIAFAESTTYRVVIQGDESFNDLKKTITHELGHIFEYEILGGGLRFTSPPLWVTEGFSDFIAGGWEDFSLLTIRDSVLSDDIPKVAQNGELVMNYGNARTPYDFGHLIYEFIDMKFGRRGVKKFLFSQRRGARIFGNEREMFREFGMTNKQFNYEFGKYTRERFKEFLLKENPEDYSYMVGPDFPYVYSFSHDISPSGEMAAVLTVDRKNYSLDIILISMKDGKIIRRITPGYTTVYDTINLKFNPEDGGSFAWNKDSNKIAFFAQRAWDDYLLVIDIVSREIVKKVKIKDIQDPASPCFVPGKNLIYFTGRDQTHSNIYAIDTESNEVSKITDGRLFIRSLNISRDGKKIIMSARPEKEEFLKLYLAPIENPSDAIQLTTGAYNDITPVFAKGDKWIFYSSNERTSFNIMGLDLENKTIARYTDVRTGNFFPAPIPNDDKHVVISSYYKSLFSLFKKDISTPQEERKAEFSPLDLSKSESKPEEGLNMDVQIVDKGKYKPLKRLYVSSSPGVGVSIGTDGGFLGYSSVTMSDLLGDHSFSLLLSSYYGYRSYQLAYFNQKGRLNFFARGFSFKDVYFPYYNTLYYKTLRSITGVEAGFYLPLSRNYRLEFSASVFDRNENYDDLAYGEDLPYGQFFDGIATPLTFSVVGETTRYSNFGPLSGSTFKFTVEKYLKLGDKFMDSWSASGDIRQYLRLDNLTLLAFRATAFTSGGKNPQLIWSGGNNSIRAVDFRRMVGNNYFQFNAELRFSLVQAMLTPIGVMGPVRGVFFFDLGGMWFKDQPFRFFMEGEGWQLRDAISSYGFGLHFFLFGYPFHVEWVWRNDFDKALFSKKSYSGINFWIGYDF